MSEYLVAACLLLLAGLLAARQWGRGGARGAGITSLVALAAYSALLAAAVANREPLDPPQDRDVPLRVKDGEYLSSGACRSCHPRQYETWHASYHRTMTQTATPESVIGDFDDVRLQFGDEHYRLVQQDGRFFGEMPARDGRRKQQVVVPLKQTTGSHHMQLYWFPTGQGRELNIFPLVYLPAEERWIPRSAGFVNPPQTGERKRPVSWNRICIECHSTRPRQRIRSPKRGGVDSHVAELGIACEACHGPGGEHVAANHAPARRYQLHFSSEPDPTIVNPDDLSHVRSSQVCGQCHVVKTLFPSHVKDWMENGSRFRPGDDLESAFNVISNANLARPSLQSLFEQNPGFLRATFWSDGIVRVSGREYNALIESPCFQRGEMSCLSCHTMHKSRDDPRSLGEWANDQLSPGMEGDRACLQCHERFENAREIAQHTHHPLGSPSSECQNCHMPHTTYGLLKAIRGHEISSPGLAAGPGSERPNACNLCHLDRSLGWTADALERWYGIVPPALVEDDLRVAAGVRWTLQGDAGVRALIAWSMGWTPAQEASGTGWLVPYLAELMNDPYDAVRMIAYRSLKQVPGLADAAFDELAPPARRVEAIAAIRSRWQRMPAWSTGRSDRTLFDESGRTLAAEYARLRARRDNRPVSLAE